MRSENYSISSHIKQLQEEVILRVLLIWTKLSQRLCLSVWIAHPLCLRVSVCLSEWVCLGEVLFDLSLGKMLEGNVFNAMWRHGPRGHVTALKWPFDSDSQPIITPLPDLRPFYVASATLPREFALPSCPLAAFHQGKLCCWEKKQEMGEWGALCAYPS